MARVTSSFRACRIVTSSPVLTELSRRRDHLDDRSEEVGVDDGDGAGRVLLVGHQTAVYAGGELLCGEVDGEKAK